MSITLNKKNEPRYLAVFDFDGTLVNTPSPDSLIGGKPILDFYDDWLLENNLPKRKFRGWWGRKESLMPPIFGEQKENRTVYPESALNKDLANKANECLFDKNVLSVLMTGRHAKMVVPATKKHLCEVILDSYDIFFDRYYFLDNAGIGTIRFKINAIQSILREFPIIKNLEIWEDREAHVSEFWNFVKFAKSRSMLEDGKVNQVYFDLEWK